MGFGFWALEEKATGAFAGEMGFAEFKREIDPPILGTPEIGWVLALTRTAKAMRPKPSAPSWPGATGTSARPARYA